MKCCTKCKENKPFSAYRKSINTRDGLQYWCADCFRAYNAQRPRPNRKGNYRNSEYGQRYHLFKTKGITIEQKKEMMLQQHNKCFLCHKEFSDFKSACVDHCHKTKRVRGILCHKCNTALGLLYDDVEVLQRAVKYLTH